MQGAKQQISFKIRKEKVTMEETRFTIPKVFLEAFVKEPRFVLKPSPGLWPVDLKVFPLLEKMIRDAEFNKNFEIVIMPR
jgi:hypothetical protein